MGESIKSEVANGWGEGVSVMSKVIMGRRALRSALPWGEEI